MFRNKRLTASLKLPVASPLILSLDATSAAHPSEEPTTPKLIQHIAASFCERSTSTETRRAYRRVINEFFNFVGTGELSLVTTADVLSWREHLSRESQPRTVALKLAIVRSFFDCLQAGGHVSSNPATTKLVPPPPLMPKNTSSRVLSAREVHDLLSGPDRSKADGRRDYALLLLMLKTDLRVSEACRLRFSHIAWIEKQWTIKAKIGSDSERLLPLPIKIKEAIDSYLQLDANRRRALRSDGREAFIFQPHTNYRTLEFDKPLSTVMAWHIVRRWAEYAGLGKLSPQDLRRTAAITIGT